MSSRILKFLGFASVAVFAACTSGVNLTANLNGTVHGGQSPISGSTVKLYAAAQFGSATLLSTSTTDASGNFAFTFDPGNCPSYYSQLYFVATGGNPGGGVNTAVHMMAIVGDCGAAHGSVVINELTTVAAAYSANRFIGPPGCVDCAGGPPSNVDNIGGGSPGLDNAMRTAGRLVSTSTGQLSSLPNAQACGAASPPANCLASRKLNTLANALAACVNSTGPGSSQCLQLFACATPGATFSSNNTTICTIPAGAVQPTDMLQALLSIARNPVRISPIGIDYTASRNAVFTPAVNVHPTDYTLSVNITGGGLSAPLTVAVDALGNVWVANTSNSSISKFDPSGIALSPGTGYVGGGLTSATGIAIDPQGGVWVANNANPGALVKFSASGTPISPAGGYTGGGLANPIGLAIDTAGNVWAGNFGNSISKFNPAGVALSPASGYTGGGLLAPRFIAIDANGRVWAANGDGNSISQFSNAGIAQSPAAGFTGGGLASPFGIAVDPFGNIWASNNSGSANSVSELGPTGTPLSPASGFIAGGLALTRLVAIDASGNVWIPGTNSNSIAEFSTSGVTLSGASGFAGAGISQPYGIAIDPSGNVWIVNVSSSSLTELIGAAAPTRTPLAAALAFGFVP